MEDLPPTLGINVGDVVKSTDVFGAPPAPPEDSSTLYIFVSDTVGYVPAPKPVVSPYFGVVIAGFTTEEIAVTNQANAPSFFDFWLTSFGSF